MDPRCQECKGKCCVGIIEVYSSDEIFYDETLVCEAEDEQFDRRMQLVGMRCIALKDGKCSIHEKRPLVCRDFDVGCRRCENYRTEHIRIC